MEEELFYQTPSILKLMLYHVQLPSREAVPVCYQLFLKEHYQAIVFLHLYHF